MTVLDGDGRTRRCSTEAILWPPHRCLCPFEWTDVPFADVFGEDSVPIGGANAGHAFVRD
jgi:hypothetical protein